MSINRRWDPAVWRANGQCHMLVLAADYAAEGNAKPWWMGDNQMELWSGPDWEHLEQVTTWPRRGTIWTAPSVCAIDDGYVALSGDNDEGPIPRQRIRLLDPYTMSDIAELPAAPMQYTKAGRAAWRDARLQRIGTSWLLTVTTGGFRWACSPQVVAYRASHWTGPWELYGGLVDPAIAVLFGEFERPQLVRLDDGRWALIFSCWSERQWISHPGNECVHVMVSAGDEPILSRYLGKIRMPYGLAIAEDLRLACGWEWTDRRTYSSNALVWTLAQPITAIVRHLETTA